MTTARTAVVTVSAMVTINCVLERASHRSMLPSVVTLLRGVTSCVCRIKTSKGDWECMNCVSLSRGASDERTRATGNLSVLMSVATLGPSVPLPIGTRAATGVSTPSIESIIELLL